jgi:hypothetical protein
MKPISLRPDVASLLLVLGLFATGASRADGEATAFDLVKEGNRFIGEQSKDRVVQIRSEKSVATLTPNLWYIVYYDPDAPLKAVEVKFGGGKKMDVKRPARLLEPITRSDEPLPRAKMKVDSDEALRIAIKEPLLARLTIKASRLTLERRNSTDDTPVWKVQLWAAKLKNPSDNADIGEVVISAEDGQVLKNDLKPEHVD